MQRFQAWIEERFPCCPGILWHRSLLFLSVSCPEWSVQTFFDCFDLFMAGEPPACPSSIAKVLMETLSGCANMSPAEVEKISKGIAPI